MTARAARYVRATLLRALIRPEPTATAFSIIVVYQLAKTWTMVTDVLQSIEKRVEQTLWKIWIQLLQVLILVTLTLSPALML
jgi:hypothetical protein